MERNRLADGFPGERTPGAAAALARVRAQYGLRLTRALRISAAGLRPQCAQWKQGTQDQRPDPDKVPVGPRCPPQQIGANNGNSEHDRHFPKRIREIRRNKTTSCVDHSSPASLAPLSPA